MGEGLKRASGAIYDTGSGFELTAGLAAGQSDAVSPLGARAVAVTRLNGPSDETDWVAEETPVALVYNDISHAVMMTTPTMLEEFALGFSLAEGIVPDASHIYEMEVHEACRGMEVRMRISSECFWRLKAHRRSMTGRTGCGKSAFVNYLYGAPVRGTGAGRPVTERGLFCERLTLPDGITLNVHDAWGMEPTAPPSGKRCCWTRWKSAPAAAFRTGSTPCSTASPPPPRAWRTASCRFCAGCCSAVRCWSY